MQKMSKTSLIGWFMLITAIGISLELLFNWRLFIPLLIGSFLIYTVRKQGKKRATNMYLIIGLSLIAIAVLSSAFLKFFIVVAVIYGLLHYSKVKKHPKRMVIETIPPEGKTSMKKQPFITNMLIGSRRIENEVFEWDDINIQYGFGNIVIDLGMTMLPPGESVVVIRGLVGDVQLLIPFDASVIVNHSAVSGKLKVYDDESELFNSNIIYYPDGDQKAPRTIKVMTSVVIGNVEVRRV